MEQPVGPYQGMQQPPFTPSGYAPVMQPSGAGYGYSTADQIPPAAQLQPSGVVQSPESQPQFQQQPQLQQQPQQGSRLEDNRPNPIQPPSAASIPPGDAPARRGFFSFMRRGNANANQSQQQQSPGQQQQPAGAGAAATPTDPEAGLQQGSLVGSQGEAAPGAAGPQPSAGQTPDNPQAPLQDRDSLQMTMVSYESSCTHYEEPPIVAASLLLSFDVGRMGGQPLPLPQRLTAEREGRTQREELGLFRERQCVLSEHSLNKMEQRITKAASLDKVLLAEIGGGNAAAAEQQVAITAQRHQQQQQLQQQQQQQQQQLTVGELPTVTEEPEGPQTEGGAGEQGGGPQLLKLPPPTSPPQPGQASEAALQPPAADGAGNSPEGPAGQGLQQQQQPYPGEGAGQVPRGSGPGMIQDPMFAYQWLDENGLMVYVPDPLKRPGHERPARRLDQDREMMRSERWKPLKVSALRGDSLRLYRMDIELGRLEFLMHPAMAQEDLLAARMLSLFRDFKRRESVGLVMFYANRLAALEDSMLGAREKLFALQATGGPLDDILDAYAMLAKLEREVAETRQLKEEEEALLHRTVRQMEALYGQITAVRQQQGYALTSLELTVSTRPPQEMAWQQGILTRERLDALLVAAEMEEVAGLPPFPQPLPVPELADLPLPGAATAGGGVFGGTTGGLMDPLAAATQQTGRQQHGTNSRERPYVFRLRRCESMCAAHGAVLADITAQLEALKNRPSTDPEDPTLKALEERAALVGRAPRRVAMTEEEGVELQLRAMERVKKGEIVVGRLPHLVPILTLSNKDTAQHHQHQYPQQHLMPPMGPGGPLAPPPGPPPRPNLKHGGRGRYYLKLYVNGHYVDSSDVAALGEDFVGEFSDVFTIQVSRFPESISAMLFERHTLRDSYIGQVYIAVPGLAGTPHVDAQPRPYQFTALTPFRPRLPTTGPGPVPLMPDLNHHDASHSFHTVFPAGVLYARCGWVSDRTVPGTRLADTVTPSAAAAAISNVFTYNNPLAERQGTAGGAAGGGGGGGGGQQQGDQSGRAMFFSDIEAGRSLMPPRATVPIDRMLRRAAERIGGKANRAQIMRWLGEHVIDPNDPRNAPLLELLKTQEAAASALGDLFRLDIFPDVAMREDRAADKRMSVLARRWKAGIYRAPNKNLLKGVRSVPVPAPLSATETEKLDSQYLDQLALLEDAAEGSQLALARVMMARYERAVKMQTGAAILNRDIQQREDAIRDFVIRVRAAAARLAGGAIMARRFRTEDVVNDAPLPQFKLELGALTQLLAPRRPLKRTRKLVKSLMTSVPKETQLLVTVQRAANLPARSTGGAAGGDTRRGGGRRGGGDGDLAGADGGPSGAPDRQAALRNCFVEVRFRSLTQRTVAVPGEFPIFNEQVELDVFRDDGSDQQQQGVEEGSGLEPSPSALQANTDLITFNVFDELITEPSEVATRRRHDTAADDLSDPVRLPQRERRFLGCIRVPLSAVYQLQVLEGTFKLETPPVLLGYLQTSERPATLTLHLTMRPRLAAPAGEVDERVTSSETAQVNRYAQRWLADLLARPECRSRVIKVMAVDADGAAVLLCRYVAPTLLPKGLAEAANAAAGGGRELPPVAELEKLMLRVARFVAHVPYMEDIGIQKRRNDIWTTNSELLALAGGDYEEHAHLLAGYFMQLGVQCFVVMGTSICGARSHFVLTTGQPLPRSGPPGQQPPPAPAGTGVSSSAPPGGGTAGGGSGPSLDLNMNPQLLRLWNPVTGSVVAVKDPTGELREVGQLYDNHNIWANTQPTGRPWEMRWNLGAARDWQPFFGTALPPREIATLQTTPKYTELRSEFYIQLEARVEKRVEEALSRARSNFVTRPDSQVSRELKKLLTKIKETTVDVAAASLAVSTVLAESGGKGPTEAAPGRLGEAFRLIAGLQEHHNEAIRRAARADSVHGHVLALPFSDRYLEAISEAVTNTGIHRIPDDRVKFSTAVHVETLGAAFVCCIWIYVAAIRG